MPARHPDLHGLAPDTCPVALVIVDVITDFDFPDGDALLDAARPAVAPIASLAERARATGVPVVYVNDNRGRWHDDFPAVLERALAGPGRDVAERLRPAPDDYLVLKPKHSAFFQTPFETLLDHLGTRTLVLTGLTADVCLVATALDATMRDFHLVVPSNATAAVEPADTEAALAYLRRVADAETPSAADVDFDALVEAARAADVPD